MVRGFYARELGGFVTRDSCLGIRSFSRVSLGPYPARYARHLPHVGKALSVVILFPHMCVFALTLWGKRYSRIVAFPAWGRGTAPAVDRVLSLTAHLRRIFHLFHLSFIPPVSYPPLRGTFPSRGRLTIRGKPISADLRASLHIYSRRSRHHHFSFLISHSSEASTPNEGTARPVG